MQQRRKTTKTPLDSPTKCPHTFGHFNLCFKAITSVKVEKYEHEMDQKEKYS